MRKYIFGFSLMVFSISGFSIEMAKPEILTKIEVSSTDVNRIKCGDGNITGVHYSQDKNVVVDIKDENAFIKFQSLKRGDNYTYSERATEFFVTCGGDVYELILIPKISNTKTIYLSNPIKNRIESNLAEYNQLPLEEQIVNFSLALLTNDEKVLQQFNVKELKLSDQSWFDFDKTTNIGKKRSFSVDGLGLKISEYIVLSDINRRFNSKEFLDSRLSENILGVTLDPEIAHKGNPIKLIVVEKDVLNVIE